MAKYLIDRGGQNYRWQVMLLIEGDTARLIGTYATRQQAREAVRAHESASGPPKLSHFSVDFGR